MKKLLVALCVTSALAVAAHAGDEAKVKKTEGTQPQPTAEQTAAHKQLMAKYDANKDGKLDKAELAKVSAEDKTKLNEAGAVHAKMAK